MKENNTNNLNQKQNAASVLSAANACYATPVVVALCERTGNTIKPWADAGFECWCIDTAHSIRNIRRDGNIVYTWGDVRTWIPPQEIRNRIVFIAAMPPCTHVAVSDARDFRIKGTAMLRDSLEMFSACEHAAAWCGVPYFIENPVGKFSDHMRKPDYYFHPWQYGDKYTKRTCLWVGNNFVMPEPVHDKEPEGTTQKIWKMSRTDDRGDRRAETPPGFSKAVFKANYENCITKFKSVV